MSSFLTSVSSLLDQADNFAERTTQKAAQNEKISSILGKSPQISMKSRSERVEKDKRPLATIPDTENQWSVEDEEDTFEDMDKIIDREDKKSAAKASAESSAAQSKSSSPGISGKYLAKNSILQEEIRKLNEENVGLKDVWTKSREKLQRMKGVLESKEDAHQKKLNKLLNEKTAEIEHFRKLLAEQEMQANLALSTKDTAIKEQESTMKRLHEDEQNRDKEKDLHKEALRRAEEQRDEVLKHQILLTSTHKAQVAALKEQLEQRASLYEREKRNLDNRATSFESHAEHLKEDRAEWTAALAKTEQEFVQKEQQNKRLREENRWIKTDQVALKTENASKQTMIEMLEDKLSNMKDQLKEAVRIKLSLERKLEIQQAKSKEELSELEQKLEASETRRLSGGANTQLADSLQRQLKQLSSDLIATRAKYDKIKIERSEVSVLHQQSKSQVAALSAQLKRLQQEQDGEEQHFRRFPIRTPRSTTKVFRYLGPHYGRTIATICQAVETCGLLLARYIFANRAIRIGFVFYLLCFHLFLFGYLYFHTHEALDPVSKSNSLTITSALPLNT